MTSNRPRPLCALTKNTRRRLEIESLEERLVPSWMGAPPTTIVPTPSTAITLNTNADASGNASITRNEVDYYTFIAPTSGTYRFNASTPSSNVDTVLGVFNGNGQRIAYNDDISSSNTDSNLTVNLTAGQRYFFGITNYTGSVNGNYSWLVDGPNPVVPPPPPPPAPPPAATDDGFEENDTMAQASNLGTITGARTISNLVMADGHDFYKFTTLGTGTASNNVNVTFTHAQGDIDVRLYNAAGQQVGSSEGTGNSEQISLNGLAAGTYYLDVFGYNGARNPNYALQINAPTAPAPTPPPPAPTTDWFTQNISDAALQSLARTRFADGSLNRADMLAIFTQAGQDGTVNTNEFNDLKKIVANASTLHLTDDVRVLANKVVNGAAANATFQGQAVGNLHAGSTGAQLQTLVNEWFLGGDHPLAQYNGTTYGYTQANGQLFVNGAAYTDIRQGAVGDCYFLAGLGATAFRNAGAIQNMFIDNGDNTFTVRFYNNGVADYVTVDRYLPTMSNGQFIFANMGGMASSATNELWVALAEKAYAQMNESGWLQHGTANSYQAIAAGMPLNAIQQITGRTGTWSGTMNFNTMVSAWNSGAAMMLGSKGAADTMMDANQVVQNHAYVVVGYDAATQRFTVFNPWGINNGSAPGTLTLTWAQMTQSFNYTDRTMVNGAATPAAAPDLATALAGHLFHAENNGVSNQLFAAAPQVNAQHDAHDEGGLDELREQFSRQLSSLTGVNDLHHDADADLDDDAFQSNLLNNVLTAAGMHC